MLSEKTLSQIQVAAKKEILSKKNILIAYYRGRDRSKRGVLIAFVKDNQIHVGWSLCMKRDRFNKYFGITMAFHRARSVQDILTNETERKKIPHSIRNGEYERVVERAKKYFKVQDNVRSKN